MINKIIPEKPKIAIGLSGGVDSSVAALLLKKQGFNVTGVYMQCWDEKTDGCKSEEDRAYAIQTASALDLKFVTLDFRNAYKEKVIEYFYNEYNQGRTPNPDVMCNKEIKFGLFYKWAISNGFDFISTGHYARVKKTEKYYGLLQGRDRSKDQSYFLYRIDQEILAKTLFPVGDLLKTEVRRIALEKDLPSSKREESMGICFIGEIDIKKFLSKKLKIKNGDVLDINGKVIGSHDGAWFYTIGQRHGYKLFDYYPDPLYVVDKDVNKNILVVGKEKDAMKKSFIVGQLSFIRPNILLKQNNNIRVRIRHLGDLYSAKIVTDTKKDIDLEVATVKVNLNKAVFGITPGQSCVFYQDEEVLGGGIIL